jgi:hypothetical protein
MAIPLSSLPARYQQQASRQLEGKPAAIPAVVSTGKKRLRQSSTGLNKTEAAYLEHLRGGYPGGQIYTQAITLKIGNGVRYTPDFVIIDKPSVTACEVKGFMRDDAAVKVKVAASLYPWITFFLVSKRKGGGWDIQEILP